jgi:hypothetical protein
VLDTVSVLADPSELSDVDESGPGTVNVLVTITVELNTELLTIELGVTLAPVVFEIPSLLGKTGDTSVEEELVSLLGSDGVLGSVVTLPVADSGMEIVGKVRVDSGKDELLTEGDSKIDVDVSVASADE